MIGQTGKMQIKVPATPALHGLLIVLHFWATRSFIEDVWRSRGYLALPILMNRSAVRAASWRGISRVDWASAAFL